MKRTIFTVILLGIMITYWGCSEEDNPLNIIDSKITAKEELNDVYLKAKQEYPDAELACIYGRNVDVNGEIDLQKPADNIFVYVVQSEIAGGNEFYIPVFGAGAVKSPINFASMLTVIQDTTAKNTLGDIFDVLANVSISSSATYSDSPDAISKARQSTYGQAFIAAHSDIRMDMYLVPSKAISVGGIEDSADWIVSFNSDEASLVMWVNSQTEAVVKLVE